MLALIIPSPYYLTLQYTWDTLRPLDHEPVSKVRRGVNAYTGITGAQRAQRHTGFCASIHRRGIVELLNSYPPDVPVSLFFVFLFFQRDRLPTAYFICLNFAIDCFALEK